MSFSEAIAALISVTRPSSVSPKPSEYTSSSASAVEHVIAADELRPEPSGTHELNAASKPCTPSKPALRNARAHAHRVSGPTVHAAGLKPIEVGLGDHIGGEVGNNAHAGVVTWRECYVGAVRQRDRQAESRVVVGVLADQVHAPGCGPHARRLLAVSLLEQFGRPRGASASFIGSMNSTDVMESPFNKYFGFQNVWDCYALYVYRAVSRRYRRGRARGTAVR